MEMVTGVGAKALTHPTLLGEREEAIRPAPGAVRTTPTRLDVTRLRQEHRVASGMQMAGVGDCTPAYGLP